MTEMMSSAAEIIAENIRRLDGIGTHSPYTMAQKWESLFDDVKTGKANVNIGDVTSSNLDPENAFFGDSDSESQMLSSILHGNEVKLSDAKFIRQKRFVMGRRGAFLLDDPHMVDYVLCHVKGYRKYNIGSRFFKYVKARDVILSGTLLSLKGVIDMMKSKIEELINNEK